MECLPHGFDSIRLLFSRPSNCLLIQTMRIVLSDLRSVNFHLRLTYASKNHSQRCFGWGRFGVRLEGWGELLMEDFLFVALRPSHIIGVTVCLLLRGNESRVGWFKLRKNRIVGQCLMSQRWAFGCVSEHCFWGDLRLLSTATAPKSQSYNLIYATIKIA